MLKKMLLTITLILSLTSLSYAASPLTSDQIERVITTMKQLAPHMDQIDKEMNAAVTSHNDTLDPKMMKKECALIYSYSAEAKQIIENNGFSELTWSETYSRVLKAFVSIAMEQQQTDVTDNMSAAIAQIDSDPDMSPEQKDAMKQQMKAVMQAAESMRQAPKADIEAVRPYFDMF
ncbi:hypothetical protein [Desulfovibrio sp. UCD-KL4C]|uniref:hypothetical protein n=1 Tax=Desulfovibrio sp. UCD-KL4C TaxID=2578120 RepID=UPI0025B848CC|nr:hypothetical protein [Desulfovibrio sp. UCD-KL4C]